MLVVMAGGIVIPSSVRRFVARPVTTRGPPNLHTSTHVPAHADHAYARLLHAPGPKT